MPDRLSANQFKHFDAEQHQRLSLADELASQLALLDSKDHPMSSGRFTDLTQKITAALHSAERGEQFPADFREDEIRGEIARLRSLEPDHIAENH